MPSSPYKYYAHLSKHSSDILSGSLLKTKENKQQNTQIALIEAVHKASCAWGLARPRYALPMWESRFYYVAQHRRATRC